MPLHWILESKTRFVTVVADGDFTRADVEAYLAAVRGGGAVGWRKLVDGRAGRPDMGRDDMLAVGALVRGYHGRGPVGPLAIVVPQDRVERVERLLGILATADRPMRLFQDLEKARRWIEALPA